MSDIVVKWLSDSCDCETCGPSYAEGAVVFIDDKRVIDLEPVAHCYGGNSYGTEAVYTAILKHLGHTVTEVTPE